MVKGVSPIIGILLLIIVVFAGSIIIYVWLTSFSQNQINHPGLLKVFLEIESIRKLPTGGLAIYVRNLGSTPAIVDRVYFFDDYKGILLYTLPAYLNIGPRDVRVIYIPALKLATMEKLVTTEKIRLVLGTKAGFVSSIIESSILFGVKKKHPPQLALEAYRSGGPTQHHWVVFSYDTGEYKLYEGSGDYPGEPYTGRAPILEGINEYIILTDQVSWNNRPVDSPIIIIVNPTFGKENWIFTWHDPHGTWRFYLEKLSGDIEMDFLVFWEDLFNPFKHPPYVDDWKDEVIRITVFTNGTYRIAIYMAKGGYKHQFYLRITSDEPIVGSLVYIKPFGAFWSNCYGGLCYPIPHKIYYVTIS